jgi:SAM-dependent methyltransferase
MQNTHRATVDFTLSWTSHAAKHIDVYRVQIVDFRRDVFPADFGDKLAALEVGESTTGTFSAADLLESNHVADKVKTFDAKYFDRNFKGQASEPKLFRFYPTAIAREGLKALKGDFSPFRIISMDENKMTVDTNHPLAKYYLTLTGTIIKKLVPTNESEGVCSNIGEIVSSKGPGMQVPFQFGKTSFFDEYPFTRIDDENDEQFYSTARMVQHIDSAARAEISDLYSQLLTTNSKVLDFMGSWDSHLRDDLALESITGLGMNGEELSENLRLSNFIVHDLNMHQILPFEDNQVDHAICTVSIEYLTYPLKIMTEIARVIKPGGKFVVTFSERCFPTKAITIWTQLHPFERMQLVLEYFRDSEMFEDSHTYSKRGLPRPSDDKYSKEMKMSDPVYAVWGTVK